jgi:perosamine synthetase
MPRQAPWAEATNWLFTIHVDAEEFGLDSRALMGALKERGIESRPVFSPLHAAGAHKGKHAHECRVAEALGATGLSIPSSVTLDEEEQAYVIESIVAIRSGLQKGTTR